MHCTINLLYIIGQLNNIFLLHKFKTHQTMSAAGLVRNVSIIFKKKSNFFNSRGDFGMEQFVHDSSTFRQNIMGCLKSFSEMPWDIPYPKNSIIIPRISVFMGHAKRAPYRIKIQLNATKFGLKIILIY